MVSSPAAPRGGRNEALSPGYLRLQGDICPGPALPTTRRNPRWARPKEQAREWCGWYSSCGAWNDGARDFSACRNRRGATGPPGRRSTEWQSCSCSRQITSWDTRSRGPATSTPGPRNGIRRSPPRSLPQPGRKGTRSRRPAHPTSLGAGNRTGAKDPTRPTAFPRDSSPSRPSRDAGESLGWASPHASDRTSSGLEARAPRLSPGRGIARMCNARHVPRAFPRDPQARASRIKTRRGPARRCEAAVSHRPL